MIEHDVEIKNKLGLHARAAAKLVHTAARFKADIKIRKGDEEVDGTLTFTIAYSDPRPIDTHSSCSVPHNGNR